MFVEESILLNRLRRFSHFPLALLVLYSSNLKQDLLDQNTCQSRTFSRLVCLTLLPCSPPLVHMSLNTPPYMTDVGEEVVEADVHGGGVEAQLGRGGETLPSVSSAGDPTLAGWIAHLV